MKKIFSLFLVFVMCLGLCACGQENQTLEVTKENQTSEETKEETTITETPHEDPKTQMLSSATTLQCGTLYEDYEENKLNAIDKYVGKAFTVTGYIYAVNMDNILLTPFAPAIDWTTFEGCTVYLPTEELKQVKKGEIITVVGKISNRYSGSMFGIEMNEAYLVSNVVSITATVGEIIQSDYYYYVTLTTTTISSGQATFAQEFWYELGSTYPNEIVINGVSVKAGDKVHMEVTGKKNNKIFNKKGVFGEYIFPMFIETVNSINIVG